MKTITLCGSKMFYDKMVPIVDSLKAKEFNVLTPEFDAQVDYSTLTKDEAIAAKKNFIDNHITKIQSSDCVLIVNFEKNSIENYIGANTLLEMGFAYVLGKKIYIYNQMPIQNSTPEIEALMPIVLNGNLDLIE